MDIFQGSAHKSPLKEGDVFQKDQPLQHTEKQWTFWILWEAEIPIGFQRRVHTYILQIYSTYTVEYTYMTCIYKHSICL
jgi:hypothetical protein